MHISLDYWNTIASPNKAYTQRRDEILSELYGVTIEDAARFYANAKRYCNTLAEYGYQLSSSDMLLLLNKEFGDQKATPKLFAQLAAAFYLWPPIIAEGLDEVIVRANERGWTVSIGSNTDIIYGATIRKSNLPKGLSFKLFSDEIGVAKPHGDFFREVFKAARSVNARVQNRSDVWHIGDSQNCDVVGAERAGMLSQLVVGPHELCDTMMEILNNA